jgi:hypothetical protein
MPTKSGHCAGLVHVDVGDLGNSADDVKSTQSQGSKRCHGNIETQEPARATRGAAVVAAEPDAVREERELHHQRGNRHADARDVDFWRAHLQVGDHWQPGIHVAEADCEAVRDRDCHQLQ